MKIHRPKILSVNDETIVSANIELENECPGIPDTLWFKFPKKYKSFLSENMNGFVVCLLPLAMHLREEIRVEGEVSSRLLYNLKEYQQMLNFWYPREFSIINITANLKEDTPRNKKKAVMCAFSGGVDSFYTLFTHLPQNEPELAYQVSHALFIQGFDQPLEEKNTARIDSYKELMEKLGIEFVPLSTNLRNFYFLDPPRPLDWDVCYASPLVGVAMLFENGVSRFYFPGDQVLPAYFDLEDFGKYSYTLTYFQAPLLSTEAFETLYDGAYVPRIEKIKRLSAWEETCDRLSVCWETNKGLSNCGTCEKCIRTMVALDLFGALGKYNTFPSPLTKRTIRNCSIREDLFFYHWWNVKYAVRFSRSDLARSIVYALFKNWARGFFSIKNFYKKGARLKNILLQQRGNF